MSKSVDFIKQRARQCYGDEIDWAQAVENDARYIFNRVLGDKIPNIDLEEYQNVCFKIIFQNKKRLTTIRSQLPFCPLYYSA